MKISVLSTLMVLFVQAVSAQAVPAQAGAFDHCFHLLQASELGESQGIHPRTSFYRKGVSKKDLVLGQGFWWFPANIWFPEMSLQFPKLARQIWNEHQAQGVKLPNPSRMPDRESLPSYEEYSNPNDPTLGFLEPREGRYEGDSRTRDFEDNGRERQDPRDRHSGGHDGFGEREPGEREPGERGYGDTGF